MKKAEVNRKTFLYDEENRTVYYVILMTNHMEAENRDWQERFHEDLWDDILVYEGIRYAGVTSTTLSKDKWDDEEAREEFISEWMLEKGLLLSYQAQY